MEIRFTEQETQGIFLDALYNGLGSLADYGLILELDDKNYAQAKKNCDVGSSYEDVLLQILKDGNTLTLIDEEDEDDVNTIDSQVLYDRLPSVPLNYLVDVINGHDDASTADAILQTVFFNEIIYR